MHQFAKVFETDASQILIRKQFEDEKPAIVITVEIDGFFVDSKIEIEPSDTPFEAANSVFDSIDRKEAVNLFRRICDMQQNNPKEEVA